MLAFLAKVGRIVVRAARAFVNSVISGTLPTAISNVVMVVAEGAIFMAGARLLFNRIRKFFRKNKKSTNAPVTVLATENKEKMTRSAKELMNRDQDVNQDIKRFGYTPDEIESDPDVAKCLKEIRRRYGMEPVVKGGNREDNDPKHDYYVQYDKHHKNIIFYHEITEDQDYEFCDKLYRHLYSKGVIRGPWNANPLREQVEEIYGK